MFDRSRYRGVRTERPGPELEEVSRRLLTGFVVPTWIGAGFADWWCHRRTDIEHTTGIRESLLHALQMAEAGVPTLLALFFEVNAGVLAVSLGALLLHQTTAAWDVAFAEGNRPVGPSEQHIHGMLEQLPVMAVAFLLAMHPDQALAMVGRGESKARWGMEPKRRPLSRMYRAGLLGAIAGLIGVPYAEELLRCARADRAT
ncbi:MAG: hypothetical protein ACJ77A_03000 [Actinomycetota bacterium]